MRISDWSSDVCSSDLMLQIARIGADPYRGAVLFGPDAGRGDVAERLADAGTGLRDHEQRLLPPLTRLKRARRRRGIVRLAGPRLGIGVEQCGQTAPRPAGGEQIGRASCRGRVCQYV